MKKDIYSPDVMKRVIEWLSGDDTGASSKTILSTIYDTNPKSRNSCTPQDPGDFGRCYRLLKKFPN